MSNIFNDYFYYCFVILQKAQTLNLFNCCLVWNTTMHRINRTIGPNRLLFSKNILNSWFPLPSISFCPRFPRFQCTPSNPKNSTTLSCLLPSIEESTFCIEIRKENGRQINTNRELANQTKGIEILEIPDYSNIFPPLTEIIANRRVLEKEPVYKM